jgi:hypothetical protein
MVDALRREGYIEHRCNAREWRDDGDMYEAVSSALGTEIRAQDEARDLLSTDFPDAGGLVLVFECFDGFAERCPREAHRCLDTWEMTSRFLQIFGKTLLILVQTDDPCLELEPVGAREISWNQAEFVRPERVRPDDPATSADREAHPRRENPSGD